MSDHIAAFKQDHPDIWEYLAQHRAEPFCHRMYERLMAGQEIYPNAMASLRVAVAKQKRKRKT
jgi:hypothetical protein